RHVLAPSGNARLPPGTGSISRSSARGRNVSTRRERASIADSGPGAVRQLTFIATSRKVKVGFGESYRPNAVSLRKECHARRSDSGDRSALQRSRRGGDAVGGDPPATRNG